MKRRITLALICLNVMVSLVSAQTQQDTIYASITNTPVVVDGVADETCWQTAEWHAIDQVWMPYGATMAEGDFEGKFKVSWDKDYLYVLVEIVDNMLSDDHSNPTDSWWADDCVEAFIDENRSKGDHRNNNNAFAYHMSIFYDAIDLDASGNGVNYKENVDLVIDTIAENTYVWEMAIKNYTASFNVNDPEASRVILTHNKLMGFTLAYCDNDETDGRENFIGSMYMTQSTADNNYITADYFGTLLLVDPDYVPVTAVSNHAEKGLTKVFPNPASDKLTIENPTSAMLGFEIYSLSGVLLFSEQSNSSFHTLDISTLESGSYLLLVKSEETTVMKKLIKY